MWYSSLIFWVSLIVRKSIAGDIAGPIAQCHSRSSKGGVMIAIILVEFSLLYYFSLVSGRLRTYIRFDISSGLPGI
jgi:hypothetical protein